MIAVLAALAAFFVPPVAGLVSRTHMAGVWLTAAMCAVVACMLLWQPFAVVTAVLSMLLAVLAVGVSPTGPGRRRRRLDREVEAFIREVEMFVWEAEDADTDPYGPGPVS